MIWKCLLAVLVLCTIALAAVAAEEASDVADIPSEDLAVKDNARMRYFLIGPNEGDEEPEGGFGLLVVMPGGDGSADFHPFVRRIFKNATPDGYLIAQPVAVKWTPGQRIVWPTKTNNVDGAKFTTEEFVEAVVKDVGEKHTLDGKRVFTLSWSSSGPAAYAISLQKETSVTGSFIAMSVFRTRWLPPLSAAKGRAYYIYHSPQDKVCPFPMAREASRGLKKAGAVVKFATYQGGHGWRGNLYGDIWTGIEWLESRNASAEKDETP